MASNPDFNRMLDLDRTTAISDFVERFEQCMREKEAAEDDIKELAAEAKEAEFGPDDIQAMKKVARLRLKDQVTKARDQLAALQRISNAVQLTLFE
jgi:uncharacterized protein (UPF0335 family)